MANKLIQAFWWISDKFSVRMKIMGIVLFGIFLLGIVVTLLTNPVINKAMSEKLQEQGISIARDVAARSTDYIYTNNIYALYELVSDTMKNNADVRYIIIFDAGGDPLVHTFPKGVPIKLKELNKVGGEERFQIVPFKSEGGIIQDVAVPIFEGRAGTVRVGMSHDGIRMAVADSTRLIFASVLVISLLGIVAALILTMVLTRPIKQLVATMEKVAEGDYNARVPQWKSKDELGKMVEAFNSMTEKLAISHQKLEEFSDSIVKRNRELATYNSILQTVSSSLNLGKILHDSLWKFVKIFDLNNCKVAALNETGQKVVLGYEVGDGKNEAKKMSPMEITNPKMRKAIQTQQAIWEQKNQDSIVHIPLLTKQRAIGLLSIKMPVAEKINFEKVDFLISVGTQIGISIENAMLWQEVKQKDEIRAQLLQKAINAQEDERKRVARELHDETSQSLSSFLLGLKLIEEAENMAFVKERIGELRQLVIETLADINNLALELRPAILDDLGLMAALDRYSSNFSKKTGIEVELQLAGLKSVRLMPEVETAIYRIVQESLTNIVKHAQANNVSILVELYNHNLIVIVEDDGVGFDITQLRAPSQDYINLGIYGMIERATIIGGELNVESKLGEGTTIYLRLSVERVKLTGD